MRRRRNVSIEGTRMQKHGRQVKKKVHRRYVGSFGFVSVVGRLHRA